ncbi:MAG: hypothetical protein ACXV5D_08190 [Halobacteriota archaeon]
MATRIYVSYEKAAEDYLALWRALRQEPPEESKEIARGAGYIRADTLIESASEIAAVSSGGSTCQKQGRKHASKSQMGLKYNAYWKGDLPLVLGLYKGLV